MKRAFSGSRPPWARPAAAPSRCTCSLRKPRKAVLSRGGCQPGLVMAKCMSDSSVFPSSACWYTEASVCPPDSHCAGETAVSRPECLQELFPYHPCWEEALAPEDGDRSSQSLVQKPRCPHTGSVICSALFSREHGCWFKSRLESSQIPSDHHVPGARMPVGRATFVVCWF